MNKIIFAIIFLLALVNFLSINTIYNSYVDQKFLMTAFYNNTENIPLEDIFSINTSFPNLSATTGQWLRGSYQIPSGVSSVTFQISGGTGDADLYVRYGSQPSTTAYDCRPYQDGNNEVCTINNPQSGTWHVGIRAYSAFSGVTFSYQY